MDAYWVMGCHVNQQQYHKRVSTKTFPWLTLPPRQTPFCPSKYPFPPIWPIGFCSRICRREWKGRILVVRCSWSRNLGRWMGSGSRYILGKTQGIRSSLGRNMSPRDKMRRGMEVLKDLGLVRQGLCETEYDIFRWQTIPRKSQLNDVNQLWSFVDEWSEGIHTSW